MRNYIRNYVLWTYIIFWCMVMGICGTASMVFHCPPVVMRILSNVCAWSPTIVLLLGFKSFLPGKTISEFYREAFSGKIRFYILFLLALVICGATILSVFIISDMESVSFTSFWDKGGYPIWASILFAITTGPTGEESGWRGFLRPEFNKRYGFVKSCVCQGLVWAFWHTILWFVDSDFMGLQMIPYVISNVVVMTGLVFIMNFVMERYNNLVYAVVIHFCFNFLYCFLKVDITFYEILSAVYIIIILVVIYLRKRFPIGQVKQELR